MFIYNSNWSSVCQPMEMMKNRPNGEKGSNIIYISLLYVSLSDLNSGSSWPNAGDFLFFNKSF